MPPSEASSDRRRRVDDAPSTVSHNNNSNSSSTASSATPTKVALSLIFFCTSSLGAIFVNKMCLTHYRFSYPSSLMLLQSLFTFSLLSVLSHIRPQLVPIVPIKSAEYRRVMLPTLIFVANVTVGLSALSRVNIPMFSAFRRLTVLFVMLAEYIMLHKTHSFRVMLSVLVLTLGAFVSAVGDVTFSALGYTLVFLNNALTAMYLASIKRVMKDLNLDPLSLLYYVNKLGFPLIATIAFLSGDLTAAIHAYLTRPELHTSFMFLPSLLFVAASAFCVNLSTSICTHVTSPLTTSVAGQVKNVLQTVLGFFSWGYHATPLNVAGLVVALMGQLAFGTFKYKEAARSKSAVQAEREQEQRQQRVALVSGMDAKDGLGNDTASVP